MNQSPLCAPIAFAFADIIVCIGSEWHRFPSSFFLPSPAYKVQWLDDGFKGLLPIPFNSSIGGTAAAPSYFNKLNKASAEQYVGVANIIKEKTLLACLPTSKLIVVFFADNRCGCV